ncbi:glycosyltransferase [Litoribacillus peritrichatus]|uniref:Spore protein YkvP/CgeB glycosyl transferase-like domain-containing protein n=1 Tax=Litoribacillus peritrichatus TaxID=718191 RepID=A0ABP7MQL5_9GAMM
MRILHVDYRQLRRYGKTRVSWAEKLTFGLIKNDYYVQMFSDRDVAAFEAPFGIRDLGKPASNKRFLEMVASFQPDLIIAGHCDMITNESLMKAKKLAPGCKIAHCNNDPLFVPENVEKIKHRAEVVDASFVSTGRRELTMFEGIGARIYHMPNPVEASVEILKNDLRSDLSIDLLFCSNSNDFTKRLQMIGNIREEVKDELNFATFGSFGQPPIWGRDYDRALAETKMGLNLNRQEGFYWYSSARMAQLAGNGILQFTHESPKFDELLPKDTVVYFKDEADLIASIKEFHHDDAKRRDWAGRTREFFHNEMNSRLYARYITEATMEIPFSHDYVWARDIAQDGRLLSSAE